jgi:hypothetical protein
MRLQEIFTDEEWQRLEQLIYATTWKALTKYQQQRATQQRIATKPAATLKPQAAKKAKALARKANKPPHAAAPKPFPKLNPVPKAKAEAEAEAVPAYRPIKTATPLPPTTRMAVAKAKLPAPKPVANKPALPSITDPNHIDQATRRWLPPDKRGPYSIDLLSP